MKYIVFDLDDTLLDANAEVSDYTLSVLDRLKADGHAIVINTARSRLFGEEIISRISPNYSILNGGATILDSNGKTIYENHIPPKVLKTLIPELLSTCRGIFVQTDGESLANNPTHMRPDLVLYDFSKPVNVNAEKIIIAGGDSKVIEDVTQRYDLTLTPYFSGDYKRLNAGGVTKASGMQKLVEITGGKIEDTIAFGDDNGDMCMILAAGIGVIMKNAREDLKREAPFVTDHTNAEDGVARYLEKLFYGK
jgi:Cof subfamily protein (haloacid dehalogenase superfamily)